MRAAVALLVILATLLVVQFAEAQYGCRDGNLIPNCDFNEFSPHRLAQCRSGWWPYVISGSVSFVQVSGDESHSMYGIEPAHGLE